MLSISMTHRITGWLLSITTRYVIRSKLSTHKDFAYYSFEKPDFPSLDVNTYFRIYCHVTQRKPDNGN